MNFDIGLSVKKYYNFNFQDPPKRMRIFNKNTLIFSFIWNPENKKIIFKNVNVHPWSPFLGLSKSHCVKTGSSVRPIIVPKCIEHQITRPIKHRFGHTTLLSFRSDTSTSETQITNLFYINLILFRKDCEIFPNPFTG